MRDLFKPSTWFDHPRRLLAMLAGAAAFALLIVNGFGPNWADADTRADTHSVVITKPATSSPAPAPPAVPEPVIAVTAAAAPQTDQPLAAMQTKYDARLQEIEARQLDVLTQIVESRSKTIDWWLAFLGTFTAAIGVLGALVPFLLTRNLREQAAHDREQVLGMRADVERMKTDATQQLDAAKNDAQQIADRRRDAETAVATMKQLLPPMNDGADRSPLPADVARAARSIKDDPKVQLLDRLRAEALLADNENNADKALSLWEALIQLAPDDLQALFMSGYWHQVLAKRAAAANAIPEARRLSAQAGQRYQQVLTIKPDMYAAANNWGNALGHEATAIADSDLAEARRIWAQAGQRYQQTLAIKPDMCDAAFKWGDALSNEAIAVETVDRPEARRLWAQAGTRYQQALAIKPDMHEAANNWGIVLDNEATAVAATDLPAARRLWAQAGERYQQALAIKPDFHQATNNWGNALSHEATAVGTVDSPEARRLWAQAGTRYQQALAIKPDNHEAANNWGGALSEEATAVAVTDLSEARRLWAQAGQLYQQALAIKPDKHEAAYNWGFALGNEATAVAVTDLPEARRLWAQAGERYQQALAIKQDVKGAAYNCACAMARLDRVADAVQWLEAARRNNNLPSSDHLASDPDLDGIRHSPAFVAWWDQHFGPSSKGSADG